MEKISLTNIYKQFFKIGFLLLGGGYVIVPLIKQYLIDGKNWLTSEELADYYALSQSIPGVIAVNISVFTGYKLRGKLGALTALAGIITSPFISILIIAQILDKLLVFSYVQSIFRAVGIGVIILVYLSVKEIWQNSMTDIFSWVIFFATLFSAFVLKLSPAIIIILMTILGVCYKYIEQKRKQQ